MDGHTKHKAHGTQHKVQMSGPRAKDRRGRQKQESFWPSIFTDIDRYRHTDIQTCRHADIQTYRQERRGEVTQA